GWGEYARFVILRYSEGSGRGVVGRRSFGVPQDDMEGAHLKPNPYKRESNASVQLAHAAAAAGKCIRTYVRKVSKCQRHISAASSKCAVYLADARLRFAHTPPPIRRLFGRSKGL